MFDVVTTFYAFHLAYATRKSTQFMEYNSGHFVPQANLISFLNFIHSKYLKNRILKNFFTKIFSETNLNSHFKNSPPFQNSFLLNLTDRISAIHPLLQIIKKRQLANSQLFSDDDIYSIILIK
jgi:hypothetical protein